jgi:hypothetical protein
MRIPVHEVSHSKEASVHDILPAFVFHYIE